MEKRSENAFLTYVESSIRLQILDIVKFCITVAEKMD